MSRQALMSVEFAHARTAWVMGHVSTPRGRACALLLLLFALALTGWMCWREIAWQREGEDLEETLLTARGQLKALERAAQLDRPAANELTVAQRHRLDEVVLQLNTPWPAIFDLVERTKMANVALIGMEPDAKSRRMRLTAEGKELEALYAYAARLSKEPEVAQVLLLNHERQDNAPEQPVRLTADVLWRGVAQGQGEQP